MKRKKLTDDVRDQQRLDAQYEIDLARRLMDGVKALAESIGNDGDAICHLINAADAELGHAKACLTDDTQDEYV